MHTLNDPSAERYMYFLSKYLFMLIRATPGCSQLDLRDWRMLQIIVQRG